MLGIMPLVSMSDRRLGVELQIPHSQTCGRSADWQVPPPSYDIRGFLVGLEASVRRSVARLPTPLRTFYHWLLVY